METPQLPHINQSSKTPQNVKRPQNRRMLSSFDPAASQNCAIPETSKKQILKNIGGTGKGLLYQSKIDNPASLLVA